MEINKSKFHNTGFLTKRIITEIRSSQGLQSQDISNVCINYFEENNRKLCPLTLTPLRLTPLPTYNISEENTCKLLLI
jgi:hypothetical protein